MLNEIWFSAYAHLEVESAIIKTFLPISLKYSEIVMPVYMLASRAATDMLAMLTINEAFCIKEYYFPFLYILSIGNSYNISAV